VNKKKAEEEARQAEIKRKRKEIKKALKEKFKSKLMVRYLHRIYLASKVSMYNSLIVEKVRRLKKFKIFGAFRRGVFYTKLNREYLEKLLSISHNELVTYANFTSDLEYYKITFLKDKFYTYNDLRNSLISKTIGDGLNHVKIVIYTQKMNFYMTGLFQNLFRHNYANLKIDETDFGLDITDKDYCFKLDNDEVKSVTIVISVLFVDRINNIEQFIYTHQDSLNKFTYGLIYFDLSGRTPEITVNNLLLLLDYSNMYKTLIYVDDFSCKLVDNFKAENLKHLANKYGVQRKSYQFCNKNNFSRYFSDIIEFYNNKQIFELFDNEFEIQSYKNFTNMTLNSYYRELSLKLDSFLFNKELYISTSSITHYQWVRWFTNVRIF
jgi:hypothetical protein